MKPLGIGACALLALACLGAEPQAQGWRGFAGSWSAAGRRDTLPTEGVGVAAVIRLSGAVVLTGDGIGRGFHGEAIGFDDGSGLRVGRMVWTDQRGDRIFGRLEGEPLATGRRVVGRITGGSGRYAGLSGEFAFTWQYVVEDEGGTVQGRTGDLEGQVLPGTGER